ncbi:MAG: cyclase family protein [Blastocatellia bacterium]|nr:cyclase family protein [Blastocatellia bacterium]
MKRKTLLLTAPLSLLFMIGCQKAEVQTSERWIDLSHDFSAETVYWPTAEPFKLDTVAAGMTDKGYYYSAYQFCAAEHGGTHIDAPIHFAEGRKTVDQIPIEQLIAPAVKIDVSAKSLKDRDYRIAVEDITSWEAQHGRIPDGSIVLFYTGFGQYWPDRTKYLGTAKLGAEGVAELHFPGLHPAAADWLTKNRKINAVGLDTASIDYGQSQNYESHVTLMGQNIPAFENVANLDRVPATGVKVFALPMKIKGGSGGPLRIVALITEKAQ